MEVKSDSSYCKLIWLLLLSYRVNTNIWWRLNRIKSEVTKYLCLNTKTNKCQRYIFIFKNLTLVEIEEAELYCQTAAVICIWALQLPVYLTGRLSHTICWFKNNNPKLFRDYIHYEKCGIRYLLWSNIKDGVGWHFSI